MPSAKKSILTKQDKKSCAQYFDNQSLDCNIKKYAVRKRSMANPVHKQFEKNSGKPKEKKGGN